MKRLVVCCDGTWKAESSSTVTNIVKIAQTIRYQVPGREGQPVQQWVTYVSGPGTGGFLADRWIGGAFGLGLEANLSSAYWHLALNWEPGDEIYIFGFSRGAFTARSLAGLISRVGILTPEAMIDGCYPQAMRLYKQRPPRDDSPSRQCEAFRATHCHPEPADIDFLGVFDTVGALGVPGLTSLRHRFHDVRLTPNVRCARQALAIDERRRNFEPCLWEVPVEPEREYRKGFPRVKQVWFEGVHSDIGGGYAECGLSDIALRWMIDEAESVGLVFDRDRLDSLAQQCLDVPGHMCRHDSLGPGYRALNLLRVLRNPRSERFYWDSWRRLAAPDDRGIRLASAARMSEHEPANLRRWREELGGPVPEALIERTGDEIIGTGPEPGAAVETSA
ncbi:hypothetical protein B0T36_20430 [Nocardia donostiensis]|uniref:DUF2235 domain-containing protein n=1 Tax=Nocardia donostiensis TaxID=1538463 RepID=UPI0009DB3486|nr:DUF2235 domain-containing protein [Nocardia donostiensis]OQS13195.1 hypothetical protein B0T36_20430 [Nocardia donostiensis]